MDSFHKTGLNVSASIKPFCFLISLISAAISLPAQAVYIDGRDWRQPIESRNLSYNHVAAVCNANTGVCNGEAINVGQPNVDLTGWIWASIDDVARMFETVTGQPTGSFDRTTTHSDPAGAAWVKSAIDIDGNGADPGLFQATYSSNGDDFGVFGLTRTLYDHDSAYRAYFRDQKNSQAILANWVDLPAARQINGHWLYREVPLPGTVLLVLVGLVMLRFRRA